MTRSKSQFTAEELKPKYIKPRIKRLLAKKEPQLVEFSKKCLVMKGHKSSEIINEVLIDLTKKYLEVNLSV